MKTLVTAALISTLASGAFAHSRVDTTTPENGAVMAEVPAEIGFNFAADIRLTRVDMTHQDHPPVRLDLGGQTSFDRVFTLPLQSMGDGIYRIEWRGLGVDGHAMQGAFTFTVD
ncbi:MAG: copper resistance protein CopC [Rhodobacteraceae bacterium]|nr:copper resistance protein CopC [Paracoccaceae bacterium]MBT25852.1 copper resistance protein CopC [Paracoccaceae bacterium]